MSDRAAARIAELWLEDIASQRSWPLVRALVWIGWRDYGLLCTWMRGGPGPCDLLPGTTAHQQCGAIDKAAADDPKSREPAPLAALRVKLAAGSVKAMGTRVARPAWQAYSGRVPDSYIDADIWRTHRLSDWPGGGIGSPPSYESPFLIPSDWKWSHGDVPEPYWASVCIERKSLLEAFPPREWVAPVAPVKSDLTQPGPVADLAQPLRPTADQLAVAASRLQDGEAVSARGLARMFAATEGLSLADGERWKKAVERHRKRIGPLGAKDLASIREAFHVAAP